MDPPPGHERQVPLDVSPDRFREVGYALVDRIAALLGGLRERKVTTGLPATAIRELLGGDKPLPEDGMEIGAVVDEIAGLLVEHSLYNGHPKFLGYVTSSPAPVGMLADFLAAAVNSNVGAWALSPVATEVEVQTVRWIAELLGYPSTATGLMVSGGNVANHVGIYTALRSVFPRGVQAAGAKSLHRATLYASTETHTWLDKAVDLFGFPADALRSIRVDSGQRMDVAALQRQVESDLAAGRIPVAVIGTAGTVGTGAVDPLPEIAELCRRLGVWFHVDGAYGGFAAVAGDVPESIHGMELADSLAIDPHKWLYAPLEAGCALIRDPEKHRAAYSYHPAYYHFDEEVTNFFDFGPQNSRGFRALKVWMALKQAGRKGYQRLIADDIALARRLGETLEAHPEFEVFTSNLSIVTFRYVPVGSRHAMDDDQLSEFNKALQSRQERSGEVFVSNAVVNGRYLLRACIVNFRTTARDVAEVPEILARHGRELLAERAARA